MRLSKVRIENHNRLTDVEIEVREHLVLVGANDVGKSSVLRCLQLALGASTAQLYAQITSEDFRDASKDLVIEVALIGFSKDEEAAFADEINVDPDGGPSTMTVRVTASVDSEDTLSIERTAVGVGSRRQLSRLQLETIGWRFLGATSQARDLRSDRRSALTDLLAAVELGAEQADFDKAVETLTNTLADSKVLKRVRQDLASQLTKALPSRLKTKDFAFVPGSSADKDPLSDVRLQVQKDGAPRDLAAQSDGTRALYAIALYDLTSAGANVVGIDEPEIHLHPTSQRSLARLLKGSGSQKIVATHSPDIVSAFDSDSIVVVRPGGRIVQPEAGFLSQDERTTVRWWVRDRLEPLTASRVIAVEGLADRIIVERAADLTNRTLDRLGVSLLEANGFGDMGAIDTLFGKDGFDVPVSMLIDEDAEKKVATRLGVALADLNTSFVWISRRDLEDEYVRALGATALAAALQTSTLLKPNELASLKASGPGGAFTDADVAAFCRTKKVQSALVAVTLMGETEARAIASIEGMLAQIEAAL
ncbi:AAA family ATPase [Curtobacterium flaccumfaciens]|uniref:ATP-dependent nuclease n=1 Tax=Curtobacterium flaccumfaciens TaxID=2035 RepID=UPI00188B3219|nr:AAA family ATPase [Curtobacterium flaccumfaciens]MBF4592369.1 AAA family ATPase [Curtobacterium flaccumfaciens]